MKESASVTSVAIEQVLELSAEAHIERRRTAKDSPSFHSLTGAIAAYGKALALLVALQEREEFFAMIAELDPAEFVTGPVH
jgi:hypothetical protein